MKDEKQMDGTGVKELLEYANSIIATLRESFLVLNKDLRIISANQTFYTTFKIAEKDTIGWLLPDLGNGQWNISKLIHLLKEIVPEKKAVKDYEVEHRFEQIGERVMLLNACQLRVPKKIGAIITRSIREEELILLAIEDITKRREVDERLKTLASHDELTGCLNFRSTMELLEKEIARAQRYQKQFSIAMIDIDDFKSMNDALGHQAGNDILVAFANCIKNNLRNIDSVGRYGGDEFLVILPETDPQYVLVVLERIRNSIKQTNITSDNVREVALTFSAGIAGFPRHADDINGLIRVADNALSQAKKDGKDRYQAPFGDEAFHSPRAIPHSKTMPPPIVLRNDPWL